MVLPAKIFEIKEVADFESMLERLRDFREEKPHETEKGETINLVTEILDLDLSDGLLSGVFSRDFVDRIYFRRELVENLVTEEAPFWIKSLRDRTFLIVQAPSGSSEIKKLLTDHVANELSETLFFERGIIVETSIAHETLKDLHESNPEATKLIWFDNVDIPSVNKLCLAGSDLADTRLYQDYLGHGNIWYVVFGVQKRGVVLGITRNSVVTLFSKSTVREFIDFISEELLGLIE